MCFFLLFLLFQVHVNAKDHVVPAGSIASVQGKTFESADSAPTPHSHFSTNTSALLSRAYHIELCEFGTRDTGPSRRRAFWSLACVYIHGAAFFYGQTAETGPDQRSKCFKTVMDTLQFTLASRWRELSVMDGPSMLPMSSRCHCTESYYTGP